MLEVTFTYILRLHLVTALLQLFFFTSKLLFVVSVLKNIWLNGK